MLTQNHPYRPIPKIRVPIRNIADYSPFGVQLDGRTIQGDFYRYGYQNQEKDDEVKGAGNSVNYTFRMHDPRVGRFFAVDPLFKKFPILTPYSFSGNEVIGAIELEGLEPNRLFGSPREAVMDWAFRYADESIRDNKEYCSAIYMVNVEGVIMYAYTKPYVGTAHGSEVPDTPNGEVIVSDIHSHGAFEGYENEQFFSGESPTHDSQKNKNNFTSGTDIGGLNTLRRVGYLVNHRGQIRRYDPKTGEVRVLSNDIPCDQNDVPYNKNTVQTSYDNIINLGDITFNSDLARKNKGNNSLTVKDIETKKEFTVYISSESGEYTFQKPE